MIVDDFHVCRASGCPTKADPVLVVDPNTELPVSVSFEAFQSVTWRNGQVSECRSDGELPKLPSGYFFDRLELLHALPDASVAVSLSRNETMI